MKLALLIAIFIGSVNAVCPPDFVASTTVPGKCYYITNTSYTLFSAISYCRNNLTHGADILSIANGFENNEVASLLEPRGISRAWVGSAFYDNKSHWIATATGSSNYSHWGSGIHNGNAALITPSGSWSYTNSYNAYPIICQIYPDDPTTFPPPQTTCPAGWRPSISVRGKCYRYIGDTDFFSATRRCLATRIEDSHAELVTLTSQLEMMELSWTQSGYAWASLTSWEADDYWHWIETQHPTDYFGPHGRPENLGGTCVALNSDKLYEAPCWNSLSAICQYFPDEPPAPTLPDFNCPQGGIASITKPGTCYYVLNQNQTFQSARSACQALDTGFNYNDLFVPRTTPEYEEFEGIVSKRLWYSSFWLGLASSNGNWDWVFGQPSNITNMWCSGQPDTRWEQNDQCGLVISSSRYNDQTCWTAVDCTKSYPAICQSTNTFLST